MVTPEIFNSLPIDDRRIDGKSDVCTGLCIGEGLACTFDLIGLIVKTATRLQRFIICYLCGLS